MAPEYFVIGPNGQRFGPAPVATLNQWIQEGRVAPQTLLQDAATGAQVVARALPALNFVPQPTLAPPNANPYTMANPAQHPMYFAQANQPWNQTPLVSSGQVTAAWVGTLIAPLLMLFCFVGLAGALFGCVTGGQLVKAGNKAAGGVMIGLNVLWLLLFVGIRIWAAL
ncbi:MAG: hypothetical protein ACYC96_13820 [Fimbriimonadaceae bacterium]